VERRWGIFVQDPIGIFGSAGETQGGTRFPGIKRTWYRDEIISGQVRESRFSGCIVPRQQCDPLRVQWNCV